MCDKWVVAGEGKTAIQRYGQFLYPGNKPKKGQNRRGLLEMSGPMPVRSNGLTPEGQRGPRTSRG